MGMKKLAILTLAALGFATLMLYMLGGHNRPATRPAAENVPKALVFSGKLDIRTMDDLRVGGRRILLCGVGFTRPRALEPIVREQARQAHQGRQVDCVQVGGGTPCDGRMGASFEGAVAVHKEPILRRNSANRAICAVCRLNPGTFIATANG